MQTRTPAVQVEDTGVTEGGTCQEEAFFGDADFGKASLEGRTAFAEGQETILLEDLRAEIA